MRAGTCVVGVPTETLDVNYGTGANGKSKFHGAIQNALGAGPTGHSIVPHNSLLTVQRFDEHATVYADLFRRRMHGGADTPHTEHPLNLWSRHKPSGLFPIVRIPSRVAAHNM
jgi:hypothetical protein